MLSLGGTSKIEGLRKPHGSHHDSKSSPWELRQLAVGNSQTRTSKELAISYLWREGPASTAAEWDLEDHEIEEEP